MRFLKRLFYVSVVGLFVLTSCAKEESESYHKYEKIALGAYMNKYHSNLLENFQQDGEYYVDIVKIGEPLGDKVRPVNDTTCWVKYDFSGRDLDQNIILTRLEIEAKLAGTFTKYTHYVPFYRFCGEYTNMPIEGTHLAMRNKLTLGEHYADSLGLASTEFLLRQGSVVDLYMPSRVVRGLEGTGGYEGQYTLSDKKPLVVRITVQDVVRNPVETEGDEVENFVEQGGGLKVFDTKDNKRPEKLDDLDHPYNRAERWVNVCDTVPQVYVDFRFEPGKRLQFPQQTLYKSGYLPYSNFSQLEQDIADALKKRFYPDEDEPYVGVKELSDSVTLDGKAKIWYIGRFVDGFIFDTNITEVRKLIYGKDAAAGSVDTYTPKNGGRIQAWYYTIPNLRYGQWAAMITTSTNGYGANGKEGVTTTSGSSSGYSTAYPGYMGYYNNANSMYGGYGGYSGYYGDYYGSMYNNGYYGNYGYGYGLNYGNIGSGSGSQKTDIYTEIPPFTPLIFEIYVEPKEED